MGGTGPRIAHDRSRAPLLALLASGLALALPAAAVGVGSAKSWSRVPLEFGGTAAAPCGNLSAAVACRLTPTGVTFMAAGKPVVVPARLASPGQCECHVPEVDAAGAALMEFSADNHTWVKSEGMVSLSLIHI